MNDNSLLMTISLDIDKDTLLTRSYGIHYKYIVLHSKGNWTWEFVPKKMSPANRLLSVPRDHIQQLTGMYKPYVKYIQRNWTGGYGRGC